jgi:hypothetical protein
VGLVEIAAALSRKVRTGELSHDDYEAALRLFLTDVRNEEYVIAPLSDHVVELAVEFTRRHPLRGYDAVHLATAMTGSARQAKPRPFINRGCLVSAVSCSQTGRLKMLGDNRSIRGIAA